MLDRVEKGESSESGSGESLCFVQSLSTPKRTEEYNEKSGGGDWVGGGGEGIVRKGFTRE